jgi:hypothetical protein
MARGALLNLGSDDYTNEGANAFRFVNGFPSSRTGYSSEIRSHVFRHKNKSRPSLKRKRKNSVAQHEGEWEGETRAVDVEVKVVGDSVTSSDLTLPLLSRDLTQQVLTTTLGCPVRTMSVWETAMVTECTKPSPHLPPSPPGISS